MRDMKMFTMRQEYELIKNVLKPLKDLVSYNKRKKLADWIADNTQRHRCCVKPGHGWSHGHDTLTEMFGDDYDLNEIME